MLDAYDKARLSGYMGSREDFQKSEYLSGGIDAARAAGFAGSEDDIQDLLIGKARGTLTPYDLAVTYGFRGTAKDWLDSLNGRDGLDAYALAVSKGFDGTPEDWLASITGKDGLDAYQLALTNGFEGSLSDWLKNLQGLKGDTGPMPNHRWDGTRLQFQLPDGSYGDLVDLRGAPGKDGQDGQDGEDGKIPDHQIDGRRIRFEKPNGEWGQWVDLGTAQAVGGMGGGGSLSLQKFFDSADDFPTPGKPQILYFDKSTTPYGVYVWDGTEYQQVGGGGGSAQETFEIVSRNHRSVDAVLTYDNGDLITVEYVDGITKTLAYDGNGDLITITLSGATPAGIDLVKTLTYTDGELTAIAYS